VKFCFKICSVRWGGFSRRGDLFLPSLSGVSWILLVDEDKKYHKKHFDKSKFETTKGESLKRLSP